MADVHTSGSGSDPLRDLQIQVAALAQRVAALEAAAPPIGQGRHYGYMPPHTHGTLDAHGFIACGMPGCCTIRCRHS